MSNEAASWPACPECAAARHTRCPICQRTGADFPLADYVPQMEPVGSGELPVLGDRDWVQTLLMCPDCDEAFTPRFYRRCHACGYDFGDGFEVRSSTREQLPDRALFVLIGLGILMFGVAMYFWWIFR